MSKQVPTIVCLCGSTRFSEAFREANLRETLAGKIVLTVGCEWEILVLNVGDYVGESTAYEIYYAASQGKPIRWLEPRGAK